MKVFLKILFWGIILWFFSACKDISGIETEIKNLSLKVSTLEEAESQLQKAFETGKRITNVQQTLDNDGWIITFVDRQQIILLDANLNASFISSVETDAETGVVTLKLNNGRVFIFNLDIPFPTSIVTLCENLDITANGTCNIPIIINPSNAFANIDVDALKSCFAIRVVNTSDELEKRASSNLAIDSIYVEKERDGSVKEGLFKIKLKDLGKNSSYLENLAIEIYSRNSKNEPVTISSDVFSVELKKYLDNFMIGNIEGEYIDNFIHIRMPEGTDISGLSPSFSSRGKVLVNDVEQVSGVSQHSFVKPVKYTIKTENGEETTYTVFVSNTDMPVVYFKTENKKPITSKNTYLENSVMCVLNSAYKKNYTKVKIKGRGNSSWEMPKKSFTMKLDKKDEFLGFKKDKTFALVANYADKTLIRNEMSYQLGRDILKNMSWNPSTKYVHFFLNDSYEGVYMICETVKINESRVNVPNIEDCKNTTEIHKYGFIVEVNDRQDDICNFITPYGVKFSMKDPDGENLSEEIKKYIKNTVINYENVLYSADFNNPVSQNYFYKYFDTNSFIDWWIVNEIGKNVDANFHYSCFMYLDPSDQKLHMGPLWDFDIANGNVNFTDAQYYSGWWINQTKWLKQMFADPVFVIKAKRRWNDKKTEIDNWVNNLIQEKANSLQNDVMRNFYRWPILGTYVWPNAAGYANRTTYQSEIDFFKTWTKNRIDWMDMEINGW